MTNRFKSGLAYTGVAQPTPPNEVIMDREPTANDYQSFSIGDIWIVPTQITGPSQQMWVLMSKAQNQAVWVQVNASGGGATYPNHEILVGTGTTSINTISNASAGTVLTSNGIGADPSFQTLSNGTFLTATGTITSAQIKAIHGTPITVIAAPAAGSFIYVNSLSFKLNYGGNNAFINGGGQPLGMNYTDGSGASICASVVSNSLITSTSSKYTITAGSGVSSIDNVATAAVEAQPVVVLNPSATEITGNAANDNTITYAIQYSIITI